MHIVKMSRKKKYKGYCVVQFLELPFKGIDNYVCVPNNWIPRDTYIISSGTKKKVSVAYPENENPFVTRDRVKRKEKCDFEWRFYLAIVEHEFDTYTDAELWIVAKNEQKTTKNEKNGRLLEEESNITVTPKSNPNCRKPLPRISIKRPALLEPKKLDEKRLKPDDVAAQSSSTVVNDTNAVPGCSKWTQQTTFQENQLECSQTEEIVAISNDSTEQRTQTQHTEGNKQAPNLPVIVVDEPTEVIIKEEYDSLTIETPNQHSQEYILDSDSLQSKFAPRIENVRSIANVHYDHELGVNEISNNKASTPPEIRDSLKTSTPLDHMKESQRTVPIEKRVEKKMPFMSINRNLTTVAHNLSNLMDQHRYSSTRSIEQPSVIAHNQSKDGPRVLEMHTGNNIDQTAPPKRNPQEIQRVPKIIIERCNVMAPVNPKSVLQSVTNIAPASQNFFISSSHQRPSFDQRLDGQSSSTHAQYLMRSHQNQYLPTNQDNFKQNILRGSTESNNYDHYPNSQTISMRIPSIGQNSTNHSNLTLELPQQRQAQPNLQGSQQQLQRPKIHDIAIKDKNNRQMSTLQGVTKKAAPPTLTKVVNSEQEPQTSTHNIYLLNELQGRPNAQSTIYNNNDTCVTTSPQNIAASATRHERNSEMPSYSFFQSPRIQHTTAHENVYQNLHFSERANSERERVHFMDDVNRLPTIESRQNVLDNEYQTDEYTIEEPVSQYNAVTSDSENVRISNQEMSTNEPPVETINNVNCTAISAESSSADIPTAAQNSTSPNHQTDPRVVSKQQMLESFASLLTQMGSTLRYTCDMYNNLRTSIIETAATYRSLLNAMERYNTLENSASNPTPLSNLTPEVAQATEESYTGVTTRANSTYVNQHSNNEASKAVTKKHNNLRWLALPPEYDPHDTRWTLKYPTTLPGLIELMPQSGTYVHYGQLKYCQDVSKDCKSLARRLLLEVFNRKALSVCLSMDEKAQTSDNVGSNVRPALDERASVALLNYVIDYGRQRGWNTDQQSILTTLHNEIQKIRFIYS